MSAEARLIPTKENDTSAALARLEADGFILRAAESWRTSRQWQRAMARAAVTLWEKGDAGDDLRVPIALALLEEYSAKLEDEVLAELIEAMLPIEVAALGLAGHA